MPKYMVVGDVHLSDEAKAPLNRKGHWTEELFDKLKFIGELAKKQKCDAILQLGDLYHSPSYHANSSELIQRTHNVLTAADIPVVIVSGNHELRHNDYENDIPKHALGALGRMRGINLLVGPSQEFPEVFGVPYLQDWTTLPKWIDQYNSYMDDHPEIKRGIIITHMSLFPLKDAPIYEFISDEDLTEMIKHPTTVMHGHLHFQQGARTYNDVEIINYGAISRGSLHKETLERQPQVYVYNSDTGKHRVFNVPVKDPAEVFNLESHLLEKERTQKLTGFLDGLNNETTSLISSTDELINSVSSQKSVSSEVRILIEDLLSSVE